MQWGQRVLKVLQVQRGGVRRIILWKRRGDLKLAVFSYRKPNP